MATSLQAQVFLFSNPAVVGTIQQQAAAYQQRLAEVQAELRANGEVVIANGQASTRYTLGDGHALEPAVRSVFGYRGQSTQLVPLGLPLFRQFMSQRGLAQADVGGQALAKLRGTCGTMLSSTLGAPPERVHLTPGGLVVDG
jgi:hypothetical protein